MRFEKSSPGIDRVIFSKRALVTEEASVQWESIQTMTKTYLYPLHEGSCMKSIELQWSIQQFKMSE